MSLVNVVNAEPQGGTHNKLTGSMYDIKQYKSSEFSYCPLKITHTTPFIVLATEKVYIFLPKLLQIMISVLYKYEVIHHKFYAVESNEKIVSVKSGVSYKVSCQSKTDISCYVVTGQVNPKKYI